MIFIPSRIKTAEFANGTEQMHWDLQSLRLKRNAGRERDEKPYNLYFDENVIRK